MVFNFSCSQEIGGTGCGKKFLIFAGLIMYCSIFPLLYIFGPEEGWFTKTEISYGVVSYYFVVNTLFWIGLGYFIVGCITYPYSNSLFNNSHKR